VVKVQWWHPRNGSFESSYPSETKHRSCHLLALWSSVAWWRVTTGDSFIGSYDDEIDQNGILSKQLCIWMRAKALSFEGQTACRRAGSLGSHLTRSKLHV